MEMPGGFGEALRRHYQVKAGPTRPDVEVFPFQKRINRRAQVEGESVRFASKKENQLRPRSSVPDFSGEAA